MQPFFVAAGPDRFTPTPSSAGPWSAHSQHGGPPAALLTRAVESLLTDGTPRVVGRFTMELLGPVPLTPLRVEASVVRPGRSVQMCEATLVDEDRGRPCARATAWLFPDTAGGPGDLGGPPPHSPRDGVGKEPPAGWSRGYLDAVEWRWIRGAVTEPGPGLVWMRPRVDLLDGEQMSPTQRLMACVDSASGVSAALDPAEWGFVNTELSVHLLRSPVGEWVCLDAETTLGPGSVATAVSRVYDERGLVARSAQALLLTRR
ncbi:MAG TPA: thioesterase family protein [Nocardioidaceae bacterium]|nr:thioesterase family protein [Nocardioidaceae bacterium]